MCYCLKAAHCCPAAAVNSHKKSNKTRHGTFRFVIPKISSPVNKPDGISLPKTATGEKQKPCISKNTNFSSCYFLQQYNCELILQTKTNLSGRRKNHLHNSGNYRAIKHHWLHVRWAVINCEQSVGFELMRGEFKQWLHWSGKAWRVHYEHSVFPDLLYISVLPRIQVTTLKAFPAFPMPIYCI